MLGTHVWSVLDGIADLLIGSSLLDNVSGEYISDVVWMTASDMEQLITTLANTPAEVLEFTKTLMRKQGLRVE